MIDLRELVWVARYKDGSIHTQYNADGTYLNRYADIVREKLFSFELYTVEKVEEQTLPKKMVLRIYFDTPNKKLIYRRKVYKQSDGNEFFIYLAGWQVKVGDEVVQSIQLVFPDGHVEVIGKWSKDHAFFDQPTIIPHEGEDWEFDREQATDGQLNTLKEYEKNNKAN